jgi:nucleotide-binding universal stress UspA family protein
MFKTIVWASDGSEHADHALEYAKEMAGANSPKVVALHVREITVGRAAGYPVQVDEDEVERKIQDQVKELQGSGIDAVYEQRGTTAGGAAYAIADVAADSGADLVIVGTRGLGPVSGLLLGSVTQRLLHIAHNPVLAVPPA